MFKKIKEFFTGKPAEVAPVTAPYKVPEPAATTPIPFVPAGTEASVAAPAPVVEEVKVEAPATTVGHDMGGSYTTEATPVAEATPAKKTRKPRAPKAVAEKPAAKKAATPKKAAAIKATPKAKSKKA